MKSIKHQFPFSAVVGQENFKLALLLNIIDPSIGGLLAVGDKGTGKTTLIRSLVGLMGGQQYFPFVNLPIGASEDRVLGHIHLEKLINQKQEQVVPGLLAKANNGCLYVDEINLLNDYLMDVLLDASASGGYYLEREGLSKYLESKFCLIGSMNPEEGDVRPQLKDRFGLSVQVKTNTNPEERLQIIKNRMAFDDDAVCFIEKYTEQEKALKKKIEASVKQLKTIVFDEEVYHTATDLVIAHQVEGHRADVLLLKTARAYAAYLGKNVVHVKHIQAIQNFVLDHRSNASNASSSPKEEPSQKNPQQESLQRPIEETLIATEILSKDFKTKYSSTINSNKNGFKVDLNTNRLDVDKKSKKVDVKKTISNYITTDQFELQHKFKTDKSQKHIVFVLDSTGSMLKDKIIGLAKGAIKSITEQAQMQQTLFSLIVLCNGDAEILLQLEKDTNSVLQELDRIKTGGKTNMIAALKQIKPLLDLKNNTDIIILSDGKFGEESVFNDTIMAYKMYCKKANSTTVIDADLGVVKIGMAKRFAEKIGATYNLIEV